MKQQDLTMLLSRDIPGGEVCQPLIRAGLEAKRSEMMFGGSTKKPHPPPNLLLPLEIRAAEAVGVQFSSEEKGSWRNSAKAHS